MDELIELVKYISGAAAVYFGLLTTGSLLEIRSERIHSEEQLEKIVKEEAEILDLNPDRIIPTLYEADDNKIKGSRSRMIGFNLEKEEWTDFEAVDNSIIVPMGILDIKKFKNGARRGHVRHELYHLKTHFPVGKGLKKLEWFYKEPAAILYAITGISTI
jgi:hypothetical protein